jgi:hypothetical protein
MTAGLTWHDLKQKNVYDLREIAKGINDEAVRGYTQMNKEHLQVAIAKALHIPTHEEHHVESGYDKTTNKAKMRDLRKKRDAALEGHDHEQLKAVRRQIHALNREVRKHTV